MTNTKYSEATQEFIDYVRNAWTENFHELAGLEFLEVEDDDISEDYWLYPNGGDMAFYDRRGQSGCLGLNHETEEIYKVELKNPEKHIENYSKEEIPRKVDALSLIQRYTWIAKLFQWSEIYSANTPEVCNPKWEANKDVLNDYNIEKESFADDPHLALYWLLHFGFSMDSHYNEVKEIVSSLNLAEKLPFINNTLAFFDETDDYFDVRIIDHFGKIKAIMAGENTDDKEWYLDGWYLKRRARVVWFANSYENTNPDDIDKVWKSVMLYPKVEHYLPMRMAFLILFLNNTKKWDYVSEHQEETKPYTFVSSFLNALNPNSTDAQKQVAIFFNEVENSEEIFLDEEVSIAYLQIMLLFLRKTVKEENKDKYLALVELYYKDNKDGDYYAAIMEEMNA